MELSTLPVGSLNKEGGSVQKPLSTLNTSNFSEMLSQVQFKKSMSTQLPLRVSEASSSTSTASSATNSLLTQLGSPRTHFQLRDSQAPDADDKINERALSLREYRLVLLASNIANADTPGYQARDIDVQEASLKVNLQKVRFCNYLILLVIVKYFSIFTSIISEVILPYPRISK